jgi:hypothetical protein
MTIEQSSLTKRERGIDKKIKVLGIEFYPDESLIRGSDARIYLIENQKKGHIINLKVLELFWGREIFNVSDTTLNSYPVGTKIFKRNYKNNDLIRGKDMKIYVIMNGKKKYIFNLKELQNYVGQFIYNVGDSVLKLY